MNPHLQTQEVKQLNFLVETQLKITNVVLQEHRKRNQEENHTVKVMVEVLKSPFMKVLNSIRVRMHLLSSLF